MEFKSKKLVMCTAINKPREWEMDDGRSGISYKVEISDGVDNLCIACMDEDIYNHFQPFKFHEVEIDLAQTNFDGRKGTKAIVVFAECCDD